jgi:hypothetical protein
VHLLSIGHNILFTMKLFTLNWYVDSLHVVLSIH